MSPQLSFGLVRDLYNDIKKCCALFEQHLMWGCRWNMHNISDGHAPETSMASPKRTKKTSPAFR